MAGISLKDYEKMSPKEQQEWFSHASMDEKVAIVNESVERSAFNPSSLQCSKTVIGIRDRLRLELPDEESAAKMYSELASRFPPEDVADANILLEIAEQERIHKKILEGFIKEITDKCGE